MDLLVSHRRYRLAFRHPVRTSAGAWLEREGLYVRIERPDGSVGYGEAAPIPAFGTESVEEALTALRVIGERTTTQCLVDIPRELPALRFALECALNPPEKPLHRSLAVAALLPAGRAAIEWAKQGADRGF